MSRLNASWIRSARTIIAKLFTAAGLFILVAGCAPTPPVDVPPSSAPAPIAPKVPDPASACQAAVAYIRECYPEDGPLPDMSWTEEQVTGGGSTGLSTVRYRAQDWVITISCPVVKARTTTYQVVAMNQATGFLWDGEVDSAGRVLGHALAPTPTPQVVEDPHPGWATYIDLDNRFSFRYPSGWTLEEMSGCEDESLGNISSSVKLRQGSLTLVIGCERARQGVVIERGIGEGEWLARGAVDVLGQKVPRLVLVHQGKDKAVYYNGTSGIYVDDLVFCIALIDIGSDFEAIDISRELQAEVDQIIESLDRVVLRYCRSAGLGPGHAQAFR